ncbi:TPA: terminase, partial [Stenotrophomonas maltophilia]|nr:terminase [Stenotrophomonas maltophilia]HEL7732053.1 terminase [Stenotrophomonas maltophilia]
GRLEYDAGMHDLTRSIMAIKKTLTKSQRQITYTAGRSEETGHADLAWALFHALHNEPLERPHTSARRSRLEINA